MRGFRKAPRPLIAAFVVAGLTAACGSTVPLSEQRALNGIGGASAGSGSTLSLPSGAVASGSPGATANAASGFGGSVGAAGAASAGGGGGGGGGSGSGFSGGSTTGPGGSTTAPVRGSSSSGNGPGVTASTIYVAAAYDPDAAAADSALGAANLNPGNTQAEENAVVKYVNAHGGVDGRKVQLVWYQESVQNTASTTDEQACQTWTQDNKSFILAAGTPILDQCTANAHAVALDFGVITEETTAMDARYPADFDVTGPTIDHSMAITINGLARQGYFSSGAKVGIVTWDDPYYTYSISAAAVPALDALGIKNVPVEYITEPQSYGDLGATSSSVSSAVLKFRAEGINHVIIFDGPAGVNSSGVLALEWMQQANSQMYYPRYGLNSTSGFSTTAPDMPEKELVNSIGVGWDPFLDETSSDYPPSKLDPAGQLCLKIMNSAGQNEEGSPNALGIQMAFCDEFFFMQQVFAHVNPLNQQTAIAAIDRVGGSFHPIETFGTYLSASRHDGLSAVRNIAFFPSCTCYRYTSGSYNPYG